MIDRTRRFLVDNAETLVLCGALTVIATLLVWWGVFAARLILERETLALAVLQATIPDSPHFGPEVDVVKDRTHRQMMMISGEGSVFGVALVVSVVALFFVSRQRRRATLRLVRLVQFTTHELKTPIAGVRALLQSLQLGSIPAEAQGKFLEQGLLETNRLEHLAETVLAFQRAASKQRLKPQPMSSKALIDDVIEHRRRTFGAAEQLTLVAAGDGASDALIVVDRDAFRVVLENLLDNARKYGGGQVTLRTSASGHRFLLDVVDEGEGFDPGDAERLFEPFERDTKDGGVAKHGSGLGLYISRQLARGMHGDLTATSGGNGHGATFTFTLPTAALSTAASTSSASAGGGARG
ncbi:MAG TPA: HAMP domain-containing sensor histidine kinase [Myxococcota bacterium]